MISRLGSEPQDGSQDSLASLMQECDDMEAALAEWLTRVGPRFAASRVVGNRVNCGGLSLDPQLWRTLVIIWLSSPIAKRDFSPEARGGLRTAIDSMDDHVLVTLIVRVLDDRRAGLCTPAA